MFIYLKHNCIFDSNISAVKKDQEKLMTTRSFKESNISNLKRLC